MAVSLTSSMCTTHCLSFLSHATGEFIHCATMSSNELEAEDKQEEDQGQRNIDMSKDDFFMAIAKLATSQSTTKPKVQS